MAFPALSAKTNARESAATFVGRVRERSQIASFFQDGVRLVTVVAPGGMGKTRMVTRFSIEHADDYSAHGGGGAWFFDLTDAKTVLDICAVVAAVLAVPIERGAREADVVAELGRAIWERKHLLLVFDNFENVAAHANKTIGAWLRAAPSARFLATSRVPLNLPGEQLLLIGGLDRADATQLFVERARAANPDLELGKKERALATEIALHLGGIPLAIELAAARTLVLSLDQIGARLARSLDLLVKRGDEGRHASMRRVIEDSFDLLSAEDQAAFTICAVFRGGFAIEAAEDVLGKNAIARIESLVARSLVRLVTSPEHRFFMVETIRELAAEQFERKRKDAAAIRRRHSIHYAALGKDLAARAPFSTSVLARLEAELENIVAAHAQAVAEKSAESAARALRLATSLDAVCDLRGLHHVRLSLLEQAIAIAPNTKTNDLAEALVARGRARMELRDLAGAENDFADALAIAKRLKNKLIEASARLAKGELAEISGAMANARDDYRAALALTADARADGEKLLRARAYQLHGHTLRREGKLDEAHREIDRAGSIYRAIGHDDGLAHACYESAVIALFRKRYDEARVRFDEGLALARKIGARAIEGAIETAMGSLLQELGDVGGALERHAAAVLAFRESGKRSREGNTLYYLAGAHLESGDRGEAEKLLVLARERVRGELRYEALIDGCRAVIAARDSDFASAYRELRSAEAAARACKGELSLERTIAIHRLSVEALESPKLRAHHRERARAIANEHWSDDPRFALRIFESKASTAVASLVVADDGFRLETGVFVNLAARLPLRKMLHALARKRIDAPGDALALEELLAAAWPGERVSAVAAANRVRVAIATLRKLGLRDALVNAARGYLLSPAVTVTMASTAKTENHPR